MSAAMQLHRQIKMSASLTRDVKRQVAKHLFYSAADIAEPQDSQVMSKAEAIGTTGRVSNAIGYRHDRSGLQHR